MTILIMIKFPIENSLQSVVNSLYKRTFLVVISRACNLSCSHCFMGSNVKSEIMSDDIIKMSIDKASLLSNYDYTTDKHLGPNVIEIFGGEPMLFPEKVKTFVEYAKTKNLKIQLDTNGFWGNDEKLLNFVYNLDIDWIALSIDNFHKVEKSILVNVIEKFKNHPKTEITITSIRDNFDDSGFWKKTYGLNILYNELHKVGKSSENDSHDKWDFCRFEGFMVFPDGQVRGACELCEKACNFGNIQDLDVENIYKNIIYKFPMFSEDYETKNLFNFCSKFDGSQNVLLNPEQYADNIKKLEITIKEYSSLEKEIKDELIDMDKNS